MNDVTTSVSKEAIPSLEPGTSILISGPPMIGKRELALELVAAGHENGDGLLLVMTSESAAVVIEDLNQQGTTLDPARIGIIDCMDNGDRGRIEGISTYSLAGPDDLTGLSTGSARFLRSFSNRGVPTVRHGLISVTTLLRYLDRSTVFKFLYIYKKRVADTRGLGVFTIDRTGHDPQTLTMLTSLFDGMIELRESESDRPELCVTGLDSESACGSGSQDDG